MSGTAGARAAAIEVTNLAKDYDGRPVLRGISFEVRAGEVFSLLGPNGAGKTTTVEIVEGYRRPDRGTVRVLGTDPARAGRDHRARVGLMLQGGGGIDPRMTVREVVGLHARFHADPRDPDELLRLVGLVGTSARTRYRRLSGGEKQRVGLALALVGRPELAVLDEPTAGMDVEGRTATRELLVGLRQAGVTVVLTSHDLADIERIADRIAILDQGRIAALGSPDELTSAAAPLIRFRLAAPLSESDRRALAGALAAGGDGGGGATVEHEGGGRYRIPGLLPTPGLSARLASWCAERGVVIVELRTGGGTLEERYVELIGSAILDDELDPAR
ncbi:MAG: ABC transporter ATP-binding protein [Chloroflexi bacterium]|nr:ABC transporter ATP-binding protein [Chloroflexota bacterium]